MKPIYRIVNKEDSFFAWMIKAGVDYRFKKNMSLKYLDGSFSKYCKVTDRHFILIKK